MKQKIKTISQDDLLAKVKASGLAIKPIKATEAKESCAFANCKDTIAFKMEGLYVCPHHAKLLLSRFIVAERVKKENK